MEYVALDLICALFDWLIIYFPFELVGYEKQVSIKDGRNISKEAYNCYQVILMQIIFFQYFRNTNSSIQYAIMLQFIMMLIGTTMIFDDDGLMGT